MRQQLAIFHRLLRRDARLLARRAVTEFVDDRCTQMASSISYWVFFSFFPLAIFLVTISGQFLRDDELKIRVINALMRVLPLAPDQGREQLEKVLDGVSTDISLLGLISIIGMIWTASAMMTAIRTSINLAWDHGYTRPPIRGKLVDIAMVFVVGTLVALSLAATALLQWGTAWAETLGLFGVGLFRWIAGLTLPFLVSFAIFIMIYRFVPIVRTRFSEIWPGALAAALLFEIAKNGFAFYIRNFGNYNAIYGGLGAAVIFLLFVYIAANILLFGAEIASEWPRVRAGHYAALTSDDPDDDDDDRPTRERVLEFIGSLIFLEHQDRDGQARPKGEPPEKQPNRPTKG